MSSDSTTDSVDEQWCKECTKNAVWVVNNATYPWTDRQIRIWLLGSLCDIATREFLENATLEELKKLHKEVSK